MIPITGYALARELSDVQNTQLGQLLRRLELAPVRDTGPFGRARWIPLGIR